MTTAFVLSGGGSLGSVQVGMLGALAERDFHPDMVVGTSAGALNAAFICQRGFNLETVDELGEIWRKIRRGDVFPFDPLRQALAMLGRSRSFCSTGPLRRLIESHLTDSAVEDAAIPLHIVTTDVMSGQELLISSGDAASAVLASAAIPGVFSPVEREGKWLIDGGVANNAALSHAVDLGADRVVILPAGFACDLDGPPDNPLAAVTHALTLLIEQRLIADIAWFKNEVELVVLPPLCPLSISPIDFGHADEFISRARLSSSEWLDAGMDRSPMPERFLSMHSHHGPSEG